MFASADNVSALLLGPPQDDTWILGIACSIADYQGLRYVWVKPFLSKESHSGPSSSARQFPHS